MNCIYPYHQPESSSFRPFFLFGEELHRINFLVTDAHLCCSLDFFLSLFAFVLSQGFLTKRAIVNNSSPIHPFSHSILLYNNILKMTSWKPPLTFLLKMKLHIALVACCVLFLTIAAADSSPRGRISGTLKVHGAGKLPRDGIEVHLAGGKYVTYATQDGYFEL